MAMMDGSKYPCPECEGYGETECTCCGSEVGCDTCKGTGLDPSKVDIAAWAKAEREFTDAHLPCWNWEDEGGTYGRQAADGATLAIDDFLLVRARPAPPVGRDAGPVRDPAAWTGTDGEGGR